MLRASRFRAISNSLARMAAHGPVLRSWNVQTRAHGTGDFHFGSPLGRRRSAQQAEWQQSAYCGVKSNYWAGWQDRAMPRSVGKAGKRCLVQSTGPAKLRRVLHVPLDQIKHQRREAPGDD